MTMLPLRIAWRFLRMSPAQSILILFGIAVGIAVQVFVGSLIISLQASLVNTTIGSSPHITITDPKEGQPVVYSDLVKRTIRSTQNVSAVVPSRAISALYLNGTDRVPLNIKGGTLADLNLIYKLRQRTVEGEPTLKQGQVVIGLDLARKYGLIPGDRMAITTGGGTRISLVISGIVDLGSSAANLRSGFSGPELPRSELGYRADQYSAIEVQLTDPFLSKAIAPDWAVRMGGVKVSDWQVENKDLLTALNSQSASSYMIQVFVLVAVALGIASTLAISAVQKTKQIGILKALGMADGATASIFLWQSAILGVVGTALGVGLGFLLIAGFTFGTSKSGSGFPINPQPTFVSISAGIGLLVAMLSSIIPTRRTARLDPIEVIQNG
ncbi:MAG: FtsX-like permease family protein [Coriobacteriia bacterium]|nr:FtsX-like permease family protein [Coriobacteriia bacterium]